MLSRIGIIVLFVASMMGDSDNLIVPVALILTGAAMIFLGRKETDNGK